MYMLRFAINMGDEEKIAVKSRSFRHYGRPFTRDLLEEKSAERLTFLKKDFSGEILH